MKFRDACRSSAQAAQVLVVNPRKVVVNPDKVVVNPARLE